MGRVWEENALHYSLIEIMDLCEWVNDYMQGLKKFGVSDDSLKNGFISLCNSYKRKTHIQVYPMITTVLLKDRESEPEEVEERSEYKLYTNGPKDMFKVFSEAFEVVQTKKIKDLTLRVLEVIHQILLQYQLAILAMVRADDELSTDFLIAQANNCGTVFKQVQFLIDPVKKQEICSEEDLNKAFDERLIEQQSFKIIQEVMNKVSDQAYLKTSEFYKISYLDLDLDSVLNSSTKIYEELADKMNMSASREAWKLFMKKTMAAYIQCLLNSSTKIKQKKSDEAIEKIKRDYDMFESVFAEYMTSKSMKPSLEVIGDIKNFFESSPDFLIVYIENMRNLHGPSFKINTVKALLNLRTDIESSQKAQILLQSKEIFANFSQSDKGKTDGIFNNINADGGAEEFLQEITAKEGEGDEENSKLIDQLKEDDDEDLDIEAFFKEGGIDLEELDQKQLEEARRTQLLKKKQKRDKVVEIKGDERIKGNMYMEVSSIQESSQIFGKIFSTVTDAVNMFANTVIKNRTKKFFAMKNRKLYIYKNPDANVADDEIVVKDIELLKMDEEDSKSFYLVYNRNLYRLATQKAHEAEKWFKSIELVMSKSEEYLDLNRYVDEKVFTKVTGKSLFKDYESILEENKKKLWEKELKKREAENKRKERIQREKLEAEGKKKANKVASKVPPLDVPDEPSLYQFSSQKPGKTKHISVNEITKENGKEVEEPKLGKMPSKNSSNNPKSSIPEQAVKPPEPLSSSPGQNMMKSPMPGQNPTPQPKFQHFELLETDNKSSSIESINDDRAPLLVQNEEYSDKEDDDAEERDEKNENIKQLIAINDQRTESMYDIVMQRENEKKSAKNSMASENSESFQEPKEEETKARSNLSVKSKSTALTSPRGNDRNSNVARGTPKTTVYEPSTQTS